MNQDATQEVFRLPVPVRGFFNLRVQSPPKDDPRRVELVSTRSSAMLYRVDDEDESLAVNDQQAEVQRLRPYVLEEYR